MPNFNKFHVGVLASLMSLFCFSPDLVGAQPSKRASSAISSPSTISFLSYSNFDRLQRAGVAGDSDGDSVPDIIDVDDDNDTIPDNVEGTADADLDGVADCLDVDSDNDGITDLYEAIAGSGLMRLLDVDRDGRLDASVAVGANGLANIVETPIESSTSLTGDADLDGDGIPDHKDLDADNDGIPDVVEAGNSDELFDGRYDDFLDLNGNGLADRLDSSPLKPIDTDLDNTDDYRDLDADGDGLTDRLETIGVDTDSDGMVDNLVDANMDGLHDDYQNLVMSFPDTDNDGSADFRDVDSDGAADTDARNEQSTLRTGESGSIFGCTLSNDEKKRQPIDPIFLFLLGASVMVLLRRTGLITTATKPIVRQYRALPAIASVVLLFGCVTQQQGNPAASTSALQKSYAGIGIGASFLNADTSNLDFKQVEDNSLASQLTLGLILDDQLSAEARAADLGEATFTNGGAAGYQVADISALYKLHSRPYTGFARLGVGALFNDDDIRDTRVTQKNKVHLLVGIGAEYALNPRIALRAEWQGHDVDVMHSQFSILYRLGVNSNRAKAVVVAGNESQNGDEQKLSDSDFQAVPDKSNDAGQVASVVDAANEPGTPAAPAPATTNSAVDKPTPPPSEPTVAEPEPATKPEALESPVTGAEPVAGADANALDSATSSENNGETPSLATSDEKLALAASQDKPTRPEPVNPLNTAPVKPGKITTPGDIDNDGVEDALDKCPDTNDGSPTLADGCSLFEDSVPGLTFVPDTDRLTKSGEEVLDTVAEGLTRESDIRVTVAVHTAPADDANEAMFLTRRRTIAIIRYLSNKGIDATRLRPEAYGDTQPLADAENPTDNDRVVLSSR